MRSGALIGRIGDMTVGPVICRTNIGSEIVEKTVFENIFSAEHPPPPLLISLFLSSSHCQRGSKNDRKYWQTNSCSHKKRERERERERERTKKQKHTSSIRQIRWERTRVTEDDYLFMCVRMHRSAVILPLSEVHHSAVILPL